MAIENGRIVSNSTRTTAQATQLFASSISSAGPGEERRYVDPDTGKLTIDQQQPLQAGQLFVYWSDRSFRFAELYIAVDIEGTLTWKQTRSLGVTEDKRTGKPWDPLAGFYNVLAD